LLKKFKKIKKYIYIVCAMIYIEVMENKKTVFNPTAERQEANMALSNQLVSFVSGSSVFENSRAELQKAWSQKGMATSLSFQSHVYYLRTEDGTLCTVIELSADRDGKAHVMALTESEPMLWNKKVYGYLNDFLTA